MARLPDPARSRAVLIGTSTYRDPVLPDLPAVANNLRDLAEILTRSGSFADCVVVSDPAEPSRVGEVLDRAAREADDVLLLYFAGHGVLDNRGELHLGLANTRPDTVRFTALQYDDVRGVLLESPALVRIVILDCCFSGRATEVMSSNADLFGVTDVQGTVVMTSASRNATAIARPGEPYTAFTGELIRLLTQGVDRNLPLLTIDVIYRELRTRMTALAYPTPQIANSGAAGQIGLVPNPAHVPDLDADQGDEQPEPVDEPSVAGAVDTEVRDWDDGDLEWSHDAPATVDLLHRAPIAAVIGMRLVETHVTNPDVSFLMHLDGRWGSGKSTLLNLLEQRISGYFQVVRFDAWQQSRFAPVWWSLLTALRAEVQRERPWWKRPFSRLRETGARIRRTAAPYVLAFLIVAAVAGSAGWALWPAGPNPLQFGELAKVVAAVLAVLGTLGAGALLAARLFLWDSIRGARLFEQTQANPIADIAAHFRWLLGRSDKPVVFFIDDLDRCEQRYVVDLLDTIQTLVRSASDGAGAHRRAAYFVVAADGAWLRRGYEATHGTFAATEESDVPLGYLFLDKFFQLTLPMPSLNRATRTSYLDKVLRIEDTGPPVKAPVEHEQASNTVAPDGGFMERLRRFEEGRAQSALAAFSTSAERRRTEHTLRKFAAVLGENPRIVKKFINTYSIVRAIRFLEDVNVSRDTLALWSLISVRWPNVARHLAACPEAVRGIVDPLWCADHFPDVLRETAASAELRAVVTSPHGGPLTAQLIRQCCGSPAARE